MKKSIIQKISIIILFIFIFSPIVSFADDYYNEESLSAYDFESPVSSNLSQIPSINSRHSVVLDRNSKTVLYGKNENEKCKMASTTKIMTAIVTIENCKNLNEIVTISKKSALTGGSRLGLSTNDKISVNNLLYGLMMVSGNDAAVALAEFVGGSVENFANLMNDKALDLGLNSTHFVTPHGLDQDEHYTTAYELALLSDYCLKNDTFRKIVNTKNCTITINNTPKALNNTNELLGYIDGVYGVKTGFTNGANRCLVSACKRSNLDIICVVLGADTKKNRTLDSINLINYTFNNFTVVNIKEMVNTEFKKWNKNNDTFNIDKGIGSKLDLYLDTASFPYEKIAINNNLLDKIEIQINCEKNFKAPLCENTLIGAINVKLENTELFNVSILNKNKILKKDVFYYLNIFFTNILNIANIKITLPKTSKL